MALAQPPASPVTLRPHPHLYEINTWVWLEQLSSKLGRTIRLGDVPDQEWDAIANLGFDVVWLMGVWQRSAESRRITLEDSANFQRFDRALPGWQLDDVIGSPYAVAAYIPDARMGGWNGLDHARQKLRERGVALFLDFVGNHTALDHSWTREHPEFYVQGPLQDFERDRGSFYLADTPRGSVILALAKDPYFPAWKDVAQLNHFSMQMRAVQLADLRTIASHCDGVRCDMAMLHLRDTFGKIWSRFLGDTPRPATEFWADAHAATPNLILLAEAYWGAGERLLDLGFSFVYDKDFYDAVRDIRTDEVRSRLAAPVEIQSHLMRFLENHDEPRSADVFGTQRLPSVGTLMGTVPGMRFYYQGELEGCQPHLPITLRTPANAPPDEFCLEFYNKILHLSKDDVFHRGQWQLLPIRAERDATSANIVAYEWRTEQSWKVVAVNLAGETSQGYIPFGDRALANRDYIFYDELHDVRYPRKGEELHSMGLFVRLDGFQAHLFDVTLA
jgi:Alpha amylase, catalytic domain